jgi:cell division protein FtsQ
VLLRSLVAVAVVAALAGLTWVVAFSPALAASKVEVRGVTSLSADEVLAAADVPIGTPLARLDVAPVVARVSSLPSVSSVDVSRAWPQTVVITVTERRAAYALSGPGTAVDLVDASGTPFRTVPSAPDGLLTVTVSVRDQRTLGDAATVVAALPASIREHTTSMSVESVDRIVIHLDGSRTLIWGSAQQSEMKAQVAGALVQTRATVYDVSAPSHPATRP